MRDAAISIVRGAYQAYVDKYRAAIEAVIGDDFHFTSPRDNRINREVYFDKCWKNSDTITGFTLTMTATFEEVSAGAEVTLTFENLPPGLRAEDNEAGSRLSLEQLARRFE